jgi:hypothetical protein
MIDITWKAAKVVETRQRIHKHFSIDVTVNKETHNLEIDIWFEEDLDGSRPQLKLVKVGEMQFDTIEDGTDVANDLGVFIEDWFDKNFPGLTEETQEDFEGIFSAVWDYIESRKLY